MKKIKETINVCECYKKPVNNNAAIGAGRYGNMTKQEVGTINEEIKKEEELMRQELSDFLEVWANFTGQPISGHERFMLHEYDNDDGHTTKLYLSRGELGVDGAFFNGCGWESLEDYLDLYSEPIGAIRKIIRSIASGITQYLEDIQAETRELIKERRELRSIADKLSQPSWL